MPIVVFENGALSRLTLCINWPCGERRRFGRPEKQYRSFMFAGMMMKCLLHFAFISFDGHNNMLSRAPSIDNSRRTLANAGMKRFEFIWNHFLYDSNWRKKRRIYRSSACFQEFPKKDVFNWEKQKTCPSGKRRVHCALNFGSNMNQNLMAWSERLLHLVLKPATWCKLQLGHSFSIKNPRHFGASTGCGSTGWNTICIKGQD